MNTKRRPFLRCKGIWMVSYRTRRPYPFECTRDRAPFQVGPKFPSSPSACSHLSHREFSWSTVTFPWPRIGHERHCCSVELLAWSRRNATFVSAYLHSNWNWEENLTWRDRKGTNVLGQIRGLSGLQWTLSAAATTKTHDMNIER